MDEAQPEGVKEVEELRRRLINEVLNLLDLLEVVDRVLAERYGVGIEQWAPPDIKALWLARKLNGGVLRDEDLSNHRALWVVKVPRRPLPGHVRPVWNVDGGDVNGGKED